VAPLNSRPPEGDADPTESSSRRCVPLFSMVTESPPELTGVAFFASKEPDRLAIDLSGQTLTYAEVDHAANRFAQRLLADCASSPNTLPGDGSAGTTLLTPCIPVIVEGTAELLVAAEAIERAGLVCVALDPNSPEEWVRRIVEEVGAPAVVTDLQTGSIGGIPCRHPLTDGLEGSPERIRKQSGPVHSIVFTSGSTGRPKGILHPANQSGTVSEFLRLGFGLGGVLRVGILTAGSVPASVPLLQILLENGFTIVAHEMRHPREPIGEWLRHAHVEVLAVVPTLLRLLLNSLPPEEVIEGLRFVGVFGESTTWEDVGRMRTHLPSDASVFNIYAQQELGSIAVMPVGPDTPIGIGLLPVGHPLPGRTVSIVDEDGQPVPAGGRGEIVVESPSASLGYWKEEMQGRSDVFTRTDQGTMVVRTGDAGRMRADGVLEHLGRLDHVVKIAGNRIDLAEIEAALLTLPHITDAVATTYVDDAGELRLRAFVVVAGFTLANPRVLRGQLATHLARPLLPDVIEVLDELPRLPNGKVNRQGLPTSTPRLTPTWQGTSRPPTEELERALASLWTDVLGIDDIGADDDFFDMGGDSLRAVRLAELIENSLQVDVPAWMLIEHPTIAEMAASLGNAAESSRVVTLQAEGSGVPIFVAHDNFGSLFGPRNYLTALELDQPIYGLRAAAWEGRPVGNTLQEIAADHVRDILATTPTSAVILYGQNTGSFFAFEVARQLLALGKDVPLLVVSGPGPALPLLPSRTRLGDLAHSLAALPRRELTREMISLGAGKVRQITRRIPSPKSRPAGTRADDGASASRNVDNAVELYGALARRYQPPSHYAGPLLLIKPSWRNRPIEESWRHWADGPVRVADTEALQLDLLHAAPRRLESLGPGTSRNSAAP
jgi:enterobactin synthetase component F